MKLKLLLLLSAFALAAQAQEEPLYEKKVRLGVKIGVNASVFTREVDPFDGDRSRTYANYLSYYRASGLGGVTALLVLNKRFSFGAEALFNSRGMAYREPNNRVVIIDDEGNEELAYNRFNYNIDYIEFPVMLNYGFRPSTDNLTIMPYAGLAPATVINRKTKIRYEQSTGHTSSKGKYETATLSSVNPFNTSVLLGVQVGQLASEKTSMYGDLRFSHTLLPVFDRASTPEGANLKTHMFTTSFSLGVRF